MIIPHNRGVELLLSTGLRILIKAEESEKVPGGTLEHLIAQLEFGVDLPGISFRHEHAPDLLPSPVFERTPLVLPPAASEPLPPETEPEPKPKRPPMGKLPLPENLDPPSSQNNGGGRGV